MFCWGCMCKLVVCLWVDVMLHLVGLHCACWLDCMVPAHLYMSGDMALCSPLLCSFMYTYPIYWLDLSALTGLLSCWTDMCIHAYPYALTIPVLMLYIHVNVDWLHLWFFYCTWVESSLGLVLTSCSHVPAILTSKCIGVHDLMTCIVIYRACHKLFV